MIAEVIVDIASSETDRIFDYLCDETTVVGSRVNAPFGNKTITGFVMRIKEKSAKTSSMCASRIERTSYMNIFPAVSGVKTEENISSPLLRIEKVTVPYASLISTFIISVEKATPSVMLLKRAIEFILDQK